MIGAGRLATNLGRALREAGHTIVQVYSRTEASAREAAGVMGGEPTGDAGAIRRDADLYVMAVTDTALPSLIEQICPGRPGAMFVHTAGSVPQCVFAGHARRYGVLYPMQTFSKERRADFASIPCFVEGCDEEATAYVERLALTVSRRVVRLGSEGRRGLHLAAVFASNFANHCYALAADVAARHGIPFDTLLPLIDETARKVHHLAPRQAQTGPAARHDQGVLQAQRALLADSPALLRIYDAMSESIHNLTSENQ